MERGGGGDRGMFKGTSPGCGVDKGQGSSVGLREPADRGGRCPGTWGLVRPHSQGCLDKWWDCTSVLEFRSSFTLQEGLQLLSLTPRSSAI